MFITLPPIEEQSRIARVLGSLDDKIENNRRIAETLEKIAATLFKARFVDFVDHDDLVESEIGPIPRGWSVAPLGKVATVHKDLTDGSSSLPYIGLDLMPRGSTILAEWGIEEAPRSQSARFRVGDILFGKLRPYFRKVGVAPIEGRCSTEILVVRPTDPIFWGFVLGHMSSQRFIDHCVAVSRGTRMPRSEWRDAATFEVAVPPLDLAEDFNEMAQAVHSRIRALTYESRVLAALRDALLPRLVSGQIRVPADAFPDQDAG
jgi:type I restriction enzyme S subunit